MKWDTEVETRNGAEYLKIKRVHYTSKVKGYVLIEWTFPSLLFIWLCFRLRMNMDNLFNNKELSDNMNAVFNQNHELIFNEVQEPVEKSFEKIVREIVQPVFDKFPYNELFAE